MSQKEILKFGYISVKKSKFHALKERDDKNDVNIEHTLASNKHSIGENVLRISLVMLIISMMI